MNSKYILFDPVDNEIEYFDSLDEAKEYAEKNIDQYGYESMDSGWPERVDEIVIAKVVMRSTETNRTDRPEDLDENECDEGGKSWEGIEYTCNYEMKEVIDET